jgi:predicted double-glycine peptidase
MLHGPLNISASASPAVDSHRDLRYQGVVGQTDWFTCGPAAVATLLRYYYGKETGEAQMLILSLGFMQIPEDQARLSGITALALRQAMQAKGLLSRGFRLSLDQLADYFRRGGLPVILHVTRPEQHYVVAVGMVGSQLVLADPSWGRRIMPLEAFEREKGFSGVALVPIPSQEQLAVAQARQRQSLERAAGRLQQLVRLRNRLP